MASAESTKPTSLIQDIETKTNRKVSIDVNEYEAEGKYKAQASSPLFSVLPRELRDLIWAFATAPYEDPNGKFEETAYYYRPGHTARLKTDTVLLLTCRRVWLEANALPMLQAEQSFYYNRPAPDRRDPQWMAKLTEHNRQNFGHLRLFVQMCNIEGLRAEKGLLRHMFLHSQAVPGDFQPKMLHVTIRHTDWWYWETETPLRLEDTWVKALLNNPDLRSTQTLKLELETLDYKVDQLNPILERIKGLESQEFETHIVDGKPTKTKFVLVDEAETSSWEGPANINNEQFNPYAGKTTLKYHVTTLTWKLTFPSIPKAFVPELRRAPRVGADGDHTNAIDLARLPVFTGGQYRRPMTGRAPMFARVQRRQMERERRERRAVMEQGEEAVLRYDIAKKMEEWVQRLRLLQRESRERAEDVEGVRRRMLEEWKEGRETEKWRVKWEGEGSLLKFV